MPMKPAPFGAPPSYAPTPAFYGMLGLARRAGKVTPGVPTVSAKLKAGVKFSLVLIEEDASLSTKSKLWGLCFAKGVPCLTVKGERGLGESIGIFAPTAAVAVTDEGFSQRLVSLCIECTPPQDAATERGDKEWQ